MKINFLTFFFIIAIWETSSIATAQTTSTDKADAPQIVYKNNTVFWKDNVLVQHQNGQFTPVTNEVKYANGTTVSSDGMVRLATGKTQKLKVSQALSPQGKIVLAADDIFTLATIQATEQKVVGDTETKLLLVNGKLTSVTSGSKALEDLQNISKQIALLEQMNALLEKRTSLVEANLTEEKRAEINAQRKLLDAQLTALDRRLKTKTTAALKSNPQ